MPKYRKCSNPKCKHPKVTLLRNGLCVDCDEQANAPKYKKLMDKIKKEMDMDNNINEQMKDIENI